LVFDLGGGTFDVTVATIYDKVYDILATDGDTHLGGDDFDMRIMDFFIEEYIKANPDGLSKKEIYEDKKLRMTIREKCKEAKIFLSSSGKFMIDVDESKLQFSYELFRYKFEELINDLLENAMKLVADCMRAAKKSKEEIDIVLLVGGSTYIPKVQSLLRTYFNKIPTKNINADEVVAIGAAIHAATLSIPPEEKSEKIKDVLLSDIVAHNLGVSIKAEGVMSTIIPRHSKFPGEFSDFYTPLYRNSTSVIIKVYQGQATHVRDNYKLGEITVDNIPPPPPNGSHKIEIKFFMDVNSFLHVKHTWDTAPGMVTKGLTINLKKLGGYSEEDKTKAIEENFNYELKKRKSVKKEKIVNDLNAKVSAAESSSDPEVKRAVAKAQIFLIKHEKNPNDMGSEAETEGEGILQDLNRLKPKYATTFFDD